MISRKDLLNKAMQRSHLLTIKEEFYQRWIDRYIIDEVRCDTEKFGDITSGLLFPKAAAKAHIIALKPGVIAGIEEASYFYEKNDVAATAIAKDGSSVDKGSVIIELEGELQDILRTERPGLDILQRMSGIATLARELHIRTGGRVAIAATRKTQWRYMDKKAVSLGGGLTHRLALWDAILIKDNHLLELKKHGKKDPVGKAIALAAKSEKGAFIEIEVATSQDAFTAAIAFSKISTDKPKIIMLDNMKASVAGSIIRSLKEKNLINDVLIEVSGGITPSNITDYSVIGADVLSLGYLTHSSQNLDMSQSMR